MTIEIVGNVDRNRFYCAGSFTKVLTTFVCLSWLAEKYDLKTILDDEHFLDSVSTNPSAREFLSILQDKIGSQFTLRDVCTFYDGLPYTFDLSERELEYADQGRVFKHHSITHEKTFLEMCRNCITPVDPNRCKFHYSELSIILLGYLIEQISSIKMEDLYQKYVIDAAGLKKSKFSRTQPEGVYFHDLSPNYDYPCVALMDHGFFCYGNGFFTTIDEQKQLLEYLFETPVFAEMIDTTHARAALNQIMNGLTIEIRVAGDDKVYGYDGMSYSGCNAWAYSVKQNKGYLTISSDPEPAYNLIHEHIGHPHYDDVPPHTLKIYQDFLKNRHYEFETKATPDEYQGQYRRIIINESNLDMLFTVGDHFIDIRNPEPIKYDVLYDHGVYRIACDDHMHGSKVGFYQAKSGNRYMLFDGVLYRKV
jgi:hypothetical protein